MAQTRNYGRWILLGVLGGIGVAVAVVVLVVYLIVQAISTILAGPAPIKFDTLPGLVQVATPAQATCLTWSPDAAFIAGGTWDSPPYTGTIGTTGDVYVVDVAKASVLPTLKQNAWVYGVAFSPDGKWLAVATAHLAGGTQPAELVVYDVPAFTPKFRGKAEGSGGFLDLTWTADSQTLWALDNGGDAPRKAVVRGWKVPGFEERPAIRTPQSEKFEALAVSADGKTLAIADMSPGTGSRLVRLFDTATGKEQSSFQAHLASGIAPRLAFHANGQVVAVDEVSSGLTWWDTTTAKLAEPDPVRFAVPFSGLSHFGGQGAVSPDGTKRAESSKKQARLVFEGFGGPPNQFGVFVKMMDTGTSKTWTWRLADTFGNEPARLFTRRQATRRHSG